MGHWVLLPYTGCIRRMHGRVFNETTYSGVYYWIVVLRVLGLYGGRKSNRPFVTVRLFELPRHCHYVNATYINMSLSSAIYNSVPAWFVFCDLNPPQGTSCDRTTQQYVRIVRTTRTSPRVNTLVMGTNTVQRFLL